MTAVLPIRISQVMARYARHLFADEGFPFDVDAYSRMKFGSDVEAQRFGIELAKGFIEAHGDVFNQPAVIIPAPSTTVPVAATLLSRHFLSHVNAYQDARGERPAEWTMVHRNMTYNNNYADLPREERRKLLANDSIYINRDFIEGKALIFVDDCRITGTHEEKVENFLRDEGIENDVYFACIAEYTGEDPSIEMRLNHTLVKDAADVAAIARSEPSHTVTTRALRLLLEYPTDKLSELLDSVPETFILQNFDGSIVKGYNDHPPYRENFEILKEKRNIIMENLLNGE